MRDTGGNALYIAHWLGQDGKIQVRAVFEGVMSTS